jgi:hypothetical protein
VVFRDFEDEGVIGSVLPNSNFSEFLAKLNFGVARVGRNLKGDFTGGRLLARCGDRFLFFRAVDLCVTFGVSDFSGRMSCLADDGFVNFDRVHFFQKFLTNFSL